MTKTGAWAGHVAVEARDSVLVPDGRQLRGRGDRGRQRGHGLADAAPRREGRARGDGPGLRGERRGRRDPRPARAAPRRTGDRGGLPAPPRGPAPGRRRAGRLRRPGPGRPGAGARARWRRRGVRQHRRRDDPDGLVAAGPGRHARLVRDHRRRQRHRRASGHRSSRPSARRCSGRPCPTAGGRRSTTCGRGTGRGPPGSVGTSRRTSARSSRCSRTARSAPTSRPGSRSTEAARAMELAESRTLNGKVVLLP